MPTISPAVYPNSASALLFQLTIMPSRVPLAMASSEDSTIEASKARDSSACFRSVTSRTMAATAANSPAKFGMELAMMDTLTLRPSFRKSRPSRCELTLAFKTCSMNGAT